jgi:cell division protein ZapE
LTDVFQLHDQVAALRLVVFVDRLYEQQIPVRTSGDISITEVFSSEMLHGGYRKKYLRAVSRLGALSELY